MAEQQHLHEFMANQRDALLEMCVQKMRDSSAYRDEDELLDGFEPLLDEVVRALQQHAGMDVGSPLPARSDAAVQFGAERQRREFPIAQVALHIGAISDSLGGLGAAHDLAFAASEYQIFNQCIDTLSAASAESFLRRALESQDLATTERAGFLAHELRNALSSARMAFTMLRTGQVGIASRTSDVLDRALARLEQLADQTLLDSRLHAGVPVQRVSIQLGKLLRDLAEAVPLERGIAISIDAEVEFELVADERLVVSAISNLLQNAVKFSRKGGHVVLRARRDMRSTRIEVEDECGGLPDGKADELFKPHVQAGRDRRGFGLGLAITREAIELIGGTISVRNLPGKGCVFAIEFSLDNRSLSAPRDVVDLHQL